MILVTQPFLPPKEEYQKYIESIWERNWLTNMGPLASELEDQLKRFLEVKNLLYVTNGTVALQMAIKALDLKGEIITTPFSFVATTSSIVWENCQPIFVDIDPESLNIDPTKIEASITNKTSAILATHVYGNPCDVEAIERIAIKHNLKVIYDGAHAFGVQINGKSIFEYGDISTCSLHATKLYHSIEGGLVICQDEHNFRKLTYMRNFGISGFDTFAELGINGKNSEFHAAMGLTNLNYIDKIIQKRNSLTRRYEENFKNIDVGRPKWHNGSTSNGAYYTVIFESEEKLLKAKKFLDLNGIGTRRYFFPSLGSSLPYLEKSHCPITEDISRKVLCLPLYFDLSMEEVDHISRLLIKSQVN